MKERRKPVIKDSCFYNQENEKSEGFFFKSSIMLFKAWVNRFVGYSSNFNSWVLKSEPDKCCVNPTITWIGHSSFLIQINGVNILTANLYCVEILNNCHQWEKVGHLNVLFTRNYLIVCF